ncbi:MAG: hypothetical protein E6J03_00740 [Chloroflexi bacterium]|nr:MAG: hypothetical protein E6J03_00740 [Chloroflexota bacterium]
MRTSIGERLVRQTGHDVAWWNERIAAQGAIGDEESLRRWLTEHGVTGYQQMLLVMERFGYPDHLLASSEELLDAQYHDRPQLRPILDAVVVVAGTFGPIDIQARKTYTTLLTPRRTFAAVRPTTRTRVDLALRLDGVDPGGRLLDGRATAGGGINLRIALASVDDLDDEAVALLRRAYDASR